MSDESAEGIGGNDAPVVSNTLGSDAPAELSPNQAAKALADLRWRRNNESSADGADTATADTQLSGEDNADPEKGPGETKEAEAVKDPPIERPKSWSKDEDAEWQSLPRAMQQKIVARESERDKGVTRSQQDAAEARKAAEAERATIAEERKNYINGLTAQDKILEQEMVERFPNIKSMADLEFLANEALRASNEGDATRAAQIQAYLMAFNTHSQKIASVRAGLEDAKQRQTSEERTKWADHVRAEGAKFAESLSAADKAKINDLMAAAPEFLEERGFTRQELNKMWMEGEKITLHDHRIQSLILDGMKYRDLQKAPKAVAKSDLPPVVRPGTSKPAGSDQSEQVKDLTRKLNETGDIKFAQQLRALQARRAS